MSEKYLQEAERFIESLVISASMNESEKIKSATKQFADLLFVSDERGELKNKLDTSHRQVDDLHKDRDQLRAELERVKVEENHLREVNFRQATKINEITGARYAFYNDIAEAFGWDPRNEENPSVVESINQLRSRLSALMGVARLANENHAKCGMSCKMYVALTTLREKGIEIK